jgi:hypothetical protein
MGLRRSLRRRAAADTIRRVIDWTGTPNDPSGSGEHDGWEASI